MHKKKSRFQTAFARKVKNNLAYQEEQRRIKSKYNITDENIKVIEKSNTIKFLLKHLIRFIKTMLTVIIIILAACGLIALLYPGPHKELMIIFKEAYDTIITYISEWR